MSEQIQPITAITDPPKLWYPGDPRAEKFMPPVSKAIGRYHEWPSDEATDIYNRAYEAVRNAIVEYAGEYGDEHPHLPSSKGYTSTKEKE